MKYQSIKTCFALTLLLLLSCNKKEETNQNKLKDIPEALKDDSFGTKRYSRRNDNLIDQLYQELVDKSPKLQSLEKEIENFNPNDSLDEFRKYDMKSKDYYLSAKNLTDEINDSIIKNKIIAIIEKSKKKYFGKTNEVNEILSKIADKRKSIDDYHSVLKIVLTLQLIEKYQNENLPSDSKYQNIIKKQDSIIQETNKLTPKW